MKIIYRKKITHFALVSNHAFAFFKIKNGEGEKELSAYLNQNVLARKPALQLKT